MLVAMKYIEKGQGKTCLCLGLIRGSRWVGIGEGGGGLSDLGLWDWLQK